MINIIDVVVYEKRTFTGFRTVDRLHGICDRSGRDCQSDQFERGGGFRQQDPCEPEQCAVIYLGHRTGGD